MPFNTNAWNRVRYTIWSPFYDRVASFGKQRRRSIALLDLKPGESVLLSGAGTGADLEYLPRGVRITAVDITPAMVERTASRAHRLGIDVLAEVADAQQLPYADHAF